MLPLDVEEFKKYFSSNKSQFWATIFKQTLCPLAEKINKDALLTNLYLAIKDRSYYPSKPREYLATNKGHGIARITPVLNVPDICVYFYCIQKLSSEIAKNRTPYTYGGWTLGGNDIRRKETEEIGLLKKEISDLDNFEFPSDYAREGSFDPRAWKVEWGQFTDNLYILASKNEQPYIALFDIANFYDCIRLDILENKLRAIANASENDEVSLLMHFLRYWNRDFNGYDNQTVGIPQDEVADCSRILANFYLQDYDHLMEQICRDKGAIFMRYSDDQIVLAKSKKDLENIILSASLALHKIGLSLNAQKVHFFDRFELANWFSHEWFMKYKDIDEKPVFIQATQDFLLQENTARNGGVSMLILLISKLNANLPRDCIDHVVRRMSKYSYFTSSKFEAWQLKKVYESIHLAERSKFLAYLDAASESISHNRFHYVLLSFYKTIKKPTEELESRILVLKHR